MIKKLIPFLLGLLISLFTLQPALADSSDLRLLYIGSLAGYVKLCG